MITFLSAVAVLLCFIHIYYKYNKAVRVLRKIPGPKDTFFIGNTLEIYVSPVELFKKGRELASKFNGIYSFFAFHWRTVNIYTPEDIEIVISSAKHSGKSPIYDVLKPWLRDGLLLSSGLKWHQRRKILTPTFHYNILRHFFGILEENGARLVDTLQETHGQAVDVVPILSEYTLNSICETAMGTRLHEETNVVGRIYKEAVYKLGNICVERLSNIYLLADVVFNLSALGRKSKKYLHTVHAFTKSVINERKTFIEKNGTDSSEIVEGHSINDFLIYRKKKTAMLDLLITAEKEGIIDGIGIQEEVDTFMFEGHDTTASGLTFCLMELANNKHVQDKIVAELHEIFGESDRVATIEDLSMMRYLECCIKEALRLYPPVHFIGRQLSETVKLSNYEVPAGIYCHIHIYDLHRRADLYENPLVFDPDRFLPENCVGRHPYAYIPFSAGPRNCIGQKFAMMEMKSCVAAVLRRFELRPVTRPCELQITADLVLRNSGPIQVKFVTRK